MVYEKTLKQSMIDVKVDEKEALELKRLHNRYIERRKELMKNTQFKFEYVFGVIIHKDSISTEQIT